MKAITPVDEKESGHMTLGAVCVVSNSNDKEVFGIAYCQYVNLIWYVIQ